MRQAQIESVLLLTCVDCGHKTVVEAIMADSKDVDPASMPPDIAEAMKNDPSTQWMCAPDVVTCAQCKAEFQTWHDVPDPAAPAA